MSTVGVRTRVLRFEYESDVCNVPDNVLLATVQRDPARPHQVSLQASLPSQAIKPSTFLEVLCYPANSSPLQPATKIGCTHKLAVHQDQKNHTAISTLSAATT